MAGTLYVIGIGPGDPELLTLKAVRILGEVTCICVPKGKEEGQSLALSIVSQALNLDGKEIVEAYFPMQKLKRGEADERLDAQWRETAEIILGKLNSGTDMAFITLGDPTVYSTFFYLYHRLLELSPGLRIEIIPGVSSINAAAAAAQISLSLGDEKVAILPATYAGDINRLLVEFDTVVLMKVHRVFGAVIKTLRELDLIAHAVYVVKAGMEDERIYRNIEAVQEADLHYFSMVIIKK